MPDARPALTEPAPFSAPATARPLASSAARRPVFAWVLSIALLMIFSVASSRGGFAHIELETYIPHYLSSRPILEKIFDYQRVEVPPVYRPRPLSYLADDLDVAFIGWSCAHGFPHLLSASNYIFWALDCLLLWYYFRRHLQLDSITAGLLLCILSTSPIVFLSGGYFRSAKSGSAFLLIAALILLSQGFKEIGAGRGVAGRLPLALAATIILLCACLFDEIPVAVAAAAAVVLGLEYWLSYKSKQGKAAAFCLAQIVTALALFAYYDLFLHRKFIALYTGERPSMEYQTDALAALFTKPLLHLAGAISVACDTFGLLFGNLSEFLAFLILFGLFSVWVARDTGLRWAVRIVTAAALTVLVLFGMISRHHFLMSVPARRTSYELWLTVLYLVAGAASAPAIVRAGWLSRGRLQLILTALIVSNLFSLPVNRAVLDSNGDAAHYREVTAVLLAALRTPSGITPQMLNDASLGPLYTEVSRNPIYESLHAIIVSTGRARQ